MSQDGSSAASSWAGGTMADSPGNLQNVLTAHAIGQIKIFLSVWIKNDLNNALAVAHIEKDHATVISASIYPAANGDRFADSDVFCSTAVMCPHQYCLPVIFVSIRCATLTM